MQENKNKEMELDENHLIQIRKDCKNYSLFSIKSYVF